MSIYRTPSGEEILICNGCGIAADGTRPDLSSLEELNLAAVMMRAEPLQRSFDAAYAAGWIGAGLRMHCPRCKE